MSDSGETLAIGEVARRTGLSEHALRYYEREKLTPGPVRRDASGRREYTADDLEWIEMTLRLRVSRMPIEEIRRYADLVRRGAETIPERIDMLEQHRDDIDEQLRQLQDARAAMDHKIAIYREAGAR